MAEDPKIPLDLSKPKNNSEGNTMLPLATGDNTILSTAPPGGDLSDTVTEFTEVLSTYEELFNNRYTDRDEVFVLHKEGGKTVPPLVKHYFVRQNRNFDRRGGGRGGYRGQGGGYRGQGGGYRGDNRDNYNQRHGGFGNQHHQQHGHYNQYQGDRRQDYSNHRQDRRYNPY